MRRCQDGDPSDEPAPEPIRVRYPSRGVFVWAGKTYTSESGGSIELAQNGTARLNGVIAEGKDVNDG